jgi:putative ABC transport system substrate-binding protein
VAATPGFARSQQPGRSYRIGWVSLTARSEPYAMAMVRRLAELGFVEGKNLTIDFRRVEGGAQAFGAAGADVAQRGCELIFAPGNTVGLRAVLDSTRDLPLVTVTNDFDPVAAGLVQSLARPGGRVTGVSQLVAELPAKRAELARELLPQMARLGVLSDPLSAAQVGVVRDAAARLGIELVLHEFDATPYDYVAAFERLRAARADALLPLGSGRFAAARREIIALAMKHRLPGVFSNSVWAEAGGLVSYGPDFSVSYRSAADIVAKVLNGAKAADTPIEQPRALELVLNLAAVRQLRLDVPATIRLRADRVIG